MRTLELLAPAKNLECGIAAIDHGADAVYIGAPRFGARAAVGNSIGDIQTLCQYAHLYGAKVHVTVNTIIYNEELEDTLRMVEELQRVGVDAILLQDMGVLRALREKGVWKGELHASTQCDARSAEKVRWLQAQGFQRAVLARELSVEEVKAIHTEVPSVDLEVFVHGALCVCYSGVCYASQYCFRRSANRGACAQFCRLKFDLVDSDGKVLERQRHLLSLKDMCQIDNLEALAEAGACSFKIEGRLKNVGYVKNVVAAYSRRIDELVARYPKLYRRASVGKVSYFFQPSLQKTFNRGFTNYFLHGRQADIANFDTPKAIGEYVGKVKECCGSSFTVSGIGSFANGDGLCFVNDSRELVGFRVNRVEDNRLFPYKMPHGLRPGLALYRSNDEAFEKILVGKTAERKLPIVMRLVADEGGFRLASWLAGAEKTVVDVRMDIEHQKARSEQTESIRRQLTKLGNTPFSCAEVILEDDVDKYFIPRSLLAELRRMAVDRLGQLLPSLRSLLGGPVRVSLLEKRGAKAECEDKQTSMVWQPEYARFPYLYNIANRQATAFYEERGMPHPALAFELELSHGTGELLMQCRHCIKFSLGYCVRQGGRKPSWREPLFLELTDGRRFRLEFACHECQMNIYKV